MGARLNQQRFLKKRRIKSKQYLGNKCVKCGTEDNLEFDHIDRKSCSYKISIGIAKHYRWNKLVKELDKCQLLCKKDHLIKSSLERRSDVTHGKRHAAYNLKCKCVLCLAYREFRRGSWHSG